MTAEVPARAAGEDGSGSEPRVRLGGWSATVVPGSTDRSVSHAEALSFLKGFRSEEAKKPKRETVQERLADIGVKDAEQNMSLRRDLAYGALVAVGVQIFVSNAAFFAYGHANNWDIASEVMITWLGASVLEVVGVLAIIAKNLFPDGNRS